MTVETEISTQIHLGDGTSVEFAIPFYFLDKADLRVIRRLTDGTEMDEIPLSVTGDGAAEGGAVTLAEALLEGEELHIIRWPAKTQLTRLVNANNLPPETVEQLADRLLMLHQANWKQIEKAVRLPETYSGSALVMPEPTGEETILGYDISGNLIASPGFAEAAASAINASVTAGEAASEALAAASSVGNPLDKTQNLADIPDKSTALVNLGAVPVTGSIALAGGIAPKVLVPVLASANATVTPDPLACGMMTVTVDANFILAAPSADGGVMIDLILDGTGKTIDFSAYTDPDEVDTTKSGTVRLVVARNNGKASLNVCMEPV